MEKKCNILFHFFQKQSAILILSESNACYETKVINSAQCVRASNQRPSQQIIRWNQSGLHHQPVLEALVFWYCPWSRVAAYPFALLSVTALSWHRLAETAAMREFLGMHPKKT
jgi:hypothetical protein